MRGVDPVHLLSISARKEILIRAQQRTKFLSVSFCLNESENHLHCALVVETRVKFKIGLRTDRIFKR